MSSITNPTAKMLDRRVADQAVDKSLREHRETIKAISDSPLVAGRLVTVEFIGGVPQAVQHGLGRRAMGYIVTRRDDNVHVYDATGTGTSRDDVIWLQTNNDLTATLWIF